ncbi:MAG: SH3 domain-containing protein [Gemmatimonadota bacterium]|nr:SH3 domain-containing protein [Gemmatimonadota bacterium]MDH3367877.1 SH3 domain-containing protein [Gemmatimonadota bacterium]MDH3478012.1 SH3 domain-containing protein [Gemmatimonadota bacterium]MDH3568798.1 SH3 domain-containing protein [Gemmatimonadota bacterium]MDH5549436.1 SH3 domain-containing protein [Gemmatimonadota bacterium]
MPSMRHSVSCSLLIALGSLLTGTACAGRGGTDIAADPQPTPVAVIDTVLVELEGARLSELEQRVARLQLQLLEREAQIEELQRNRDAAVEEVVRVSARLQTSASRAEAASVMAEAEIALNELRAVEPGAAEIEQASGMIEQAAAAFDAGNFGGALFVATEARKLSQTAEARRRVGADRGLQPGEAWFTTPLRLEALRRSNIREGPGRDRRILLTVEAGTPLTGLSYTDDWVRVRDENGRSGWVFYSLVGHRSREKPD